MFGRRRTPDRRSEPAAFDEASACTGELMFVTVMDGGWLSMDCVLDFGEHGRIPAMIAVELPDNPALAMFERDLIARWVIDGEHIGATLTVGTGGARLAVSAQGTRVVLPVRTADRRAYRG